MNKIKFRLKPNLSEGQELEYIRAIALRVVGQPEVYENKRGSGYKWQLGASNDWWMDKDFETGEYILAYRYATESNASKMKAIRVALIWLLGLGSFNPGYSV